MLSYCLKCRKNIKSNKPKIVKTKNNIEQWCFYQTVQFLKVKS